jgi:CHAD domain-containing protein
LRALALDRWEAAHILHAKALSTGEVNDYHRLRIGLKRFRYVVENFFPAAAQHWGRDLKSAQDLLGEVHDLAMVRATSQQCGISMATPRGRRWYATLDEEQRSRLEKYGRRFGAPDTTWEVWRNGLVKASRSQRARPLRRAIHLAARRSPRQSLTPDET